MRTMLASHLGRLSRAVLLGPLLGIGLANTVVSRGVAQPARGSSVEGLGVVRAGVLRLWAGPGPVRHAFARGSDVLPRGGFGAGGLWLQIAEPAAPGFDDVLDSPLRGATLSTGVHLLLDAGVGLEYRIRTSGEGGRTGGVLLGVETGYVFAPGRTSWGLDGLTDVRDGPKLGIEGLDLWFSLGGWGRGGSPGDAGSSSRPAAAGDGRTSR